MRESVTKQLNRSSLMVSNIFAFYVWKIGELHLPWASLISSQSFFTAAKPSFSLWDWKFNKKPQLAIVLWQKNCMWSLQCGAQVTYLLIIRYLSILSPLDWLDSFFFYNYHSEYVQNNWHLCISLALLLSVSIGICSGQWKSVWLTTNWKLLHGLNTM